MAEMQYEWTDLALYPDGESIVRGAEAVGQSIANCISIKIGELFNNPNFGNQLENLLFEPITDDTGESILLMLQTALEFWDPRLQISKETKIVPDPIKMKYTITLICRIYGLDEFTNFTFDVFRGG